MKEIKAIDIDQPADTPIESEGVAYYRLTKEMKEFMELCEKKHGILGFEWDGSFNFGVILKKKPQEEMPPSLLTRREIAEKFRVDPRTIERWMKTGKLKGYKLGEGKTAPLRFDAGEVEAFLKRSNPEKHE